MGDGHVKAGHPYHSTTKTHGRGQSALQGKNYITNPGERWKQALMMNGMHDSFGKWVCQTVF